MHPTHVIPRRSFHRMLPVLFSLLWCAQLLAFDARDVPIDYSLCGFEAGPGLPQVPGVLRVEPSGGDDTQVLQAALDEVSRRSPDASGFRGAVLLSPGRFHVEGSLQLMVSGVVLRGAGAGPKGTIVTATGTGRRSLLVLGTTEPKPGGALSIEGPETPAGARVIQVSDVSRLRPGQRVSVLRPSVASWIRDLGMDKFEGRGAFANLRVLWTPGSRDLRWDRRILKIEAETRRVELDAPITTSLEEAYGGGRLLMWAEDKLPTKIGVENLRLESEPGSERPMDEEHAWIGIQIGWAEDLWVRGVDFVHFPGSAVRVSSGARRVTIEDCRNLAPVSELAGYRRQSFLIEGQQVLVRRCWAEEGMNDFALGQLTGGPVVFLDCKAERAHGDSGAFESWASGALYENVVIEGAGLRLDLDWTRGQGGGWTAANCLVWNCRAESLRVKGPPRAPNLVHVARESLYGSQLGARGLDRGPSSKVHAESRDAVPLFFSTVSQPSQEAAPVARVDIVQGRFAIAGKALWGAYMDEGWWRGQTYPAIAEPVSGRSVTRFVPGRSGPGLTEDLPSMAREYRSQGVSMVFTFAGLWYDRRRDDHLFDARDENAWAPFYEMPWARSGTGRANDGLSRFDLRTYNPWYFERLRSFSRECDRQGLVHVYNLYNTHNVLETMAHWVDFPWRPINCINEAGIPEPPPLDAKNAVHLAKIFYNVEHPVRRELHRSYIFHTLDELGDRVNTVFGLAFQFAGPLEFQRFFLDTVFEWERLRGKKVRLCLATSKDISDAILQDPQRGPRISVLDQRYWQYRPDGGMWAPRGDQNLAFREMTTQQFGALSDTPPPTTPWLAYRQVREYRDRYPQLAIVSWHNGVDEVPALMAGAAQVIMRYRAFQLPKDSIPDMSLFESFVREELSPWLPAMQPMDGFLAEAEANWLLAAPGLGRLLLYSVSGDTIVPAKPLPLAGKTGLWFEPRTGERRPFEGAPGGEAGVPIRKPDSRAWLLWLK